MQADVVGTGAGAGVGAGAEQRAGGAGCQGGAELGGAPVGEEESQPGFVAGGAGAVVAEQQDDVVAEVGGLVGRHEQVEGDGGGVTAGAHFAADGHVEAGRGAAVDFLDGGGESDVLGIGMDAVFQAAGDADIEFAGQVGVGAVADEHSGELVGDGGGVQEFVRGQAGGGAADDGADVVHAGLEGNEADGGQAGPDVRGLRDGEVAELGLLSGGEVGEAGAVVVADAGQGAELVGVGDAVGDADAHHKAARGLAAEEDAGPLEAVAVGRGDGLPAVAGESGDVGQDVQAVFFGLDGFDFVHCRLPNLNGVRIVVGVARRATILNGGCCGSVAGALMGGKCRVALRLRDNFPLTLILSISNLTAMTA